MKHLRRLRVPWLLAPALVALLACRPAPETLAAPEPPCTALRWSAERARRNVVLVVSDTMRRDRLGAYGGPARTPAFDRFARENLLFTRAVTQSPWTKPAIATLFTGLYPSQHGVLSHPDPKFRQGEAADELLVSDALAESLVTLAEAFRDAGYRTAGFVSNPWLQAQLGFAQGFDRYDDSFAGYDAVGDVVTAAALGWLDSVPPDAPWLLYVHFMDAHWPYPTVSREDLHARLDAITADRRPMTPHAKRALAQAARFDDGARVVGPGIPATLALFELLYDAGVQQFDRAFGRLLEGLEARADWAETAVLVTSDHGEAFFERGWGGHGRSLFDEETAIPLAARLPGISADAAVACPVGLIDLTRTLFAYAGLEAPEGSLGVSLLPPATGADARGARYVVSEGVIGKPRARALVNRHFKLIRDPEPGGATPFSLFDLAEDPGETRDLLAPAEPSARTRRVFEILAAELARSVPDVAVPETAVPLDAETRERLEALGYLD